MLKSKLNSIKIMHCFMYIFIYLLYVHLFTTYMFVHYMILARKYTQEKY